VLNSAREAQNAPSYYGVFNLVWNGRLLSDHYVSKGRFKNILRKELLKEREWGAFVKFVARQSIDASFIP